MQDLSLRNPTANFLQPTSCPCHTTNFTAFPLQLIPYPPYSFSWNPYLQLTPHHVIQGTTLNALRQKSTAFT